MAQTDEICLPDTNTLLTVSYTYDGQERTLAIQGENAEHGPYMVKRFQGFLESLGFTFDHLRPPITITKVASSATQAAIVMLFCSGLSMMTPPVFAIGEANKPRGYTHIAPRPIITAY